MPAAAPRNKVPFEAMPDLAAFSRSARDAMSESTAATIDGLVAYTEAAQHMLGEWTALTLAGAKDVYALQRDASRAALGALRDTFGNDLTDQPVFQAWEKLSQAGGEVLDRLAEQVSNSIEQGNEKIKDAVGTVAVQVKDGSAKLSSALQNLEKVNLKA